jgi:hypothetical protein
MSCGHRVTERPLFRLEKLGNQLGRTYEVDILCGYSVSRVQCGMDQQIFQRICAEHSAVHSR